MLMRIPHITAGNSQFGLADESFFALSAHRLANLEAFVKIAGAANTPDNICGGPFRKEIGLPKCECAAAKEAVTEHLLHFPLDSLPPVRLNHPC